MNVHELSSSGLAILELEVLATVLTLGSWGGVVSFLIRKRRGTNFIKNIHECILQVIVSCFTGLILSAVAIEKASSFNYVIMAAGMGGVFSVPILKILGAGVKKLLKSTDFLNK